MNNFRKFSNKYPLWIQSATLFTIIITLIIVILFSNNYIYNKNKVIDTHVEHKQTVLRLEMDSLSQYIRELTSFTIQPCYDSRLTRLIESRSDITDDDINYVRDQIKEYYFTRSDLNAYEMYIMNHNLVVSRDRGAQHITSNSISEYTDVNYTAFEKCSNSKYFLSIEPSDNESDFFTFYHSIIQIDNKSSLAFVKCNIDKDFLSTLLKSYSFHEGEFLILSNDSGELLYSGDISIVDSSSELLPLLSNNNSDEVYINDVRYLMTSEYNEQYGLVLTAIEPYKVITTDVYDIFKKSFIEGFCIWLFSAILVNYLCHQMMHPLNDLASRLLKVGEGDFDSKIDINGSSEIKNLGNSFNYMAEHIDTLIRENYMVTLSEQSARLIALEAQINPHFLYNTLQAISTEALVNNQDQIHEMVISLASILRYSIKGGDYVTLADELEHVGKYIYLQKIRMDDHLSYEFEIEDAANTCIIPKISIHTLVENSIVHGIDGDVTSINVRLKAYIVDNTLNIEVTDNGCGMDSQKLESLRNSFSEEALSATQTTGVGLANLYGRLKIMYKEEGIMEVDSSKDLGTYVKISLPVKRGTDVQGFDY